MSERLIAYIDGFNLYRGMLDGKMRPLLWLDLYKLAQRVCPRNAHVIAVKYVTARILNLKPKSHPRHADEEAGRIRQSEYIEALKSRGVQVFEGKFKLRRMRCRSCNSTWDKPEEKASDVQLATQLLSDAFRGEFDIAMIVTGDADLAPAVRVVVNEVGRRVIVAFPPNRVLAELKSIASDYIHINKHAIAKSQLPDQFTHAKHTFRRPIAWSRSKRIVKPT